jgi:transcriptional regulator with XRE-family HTH domain
MKVIGYATSPAEIVALLEQRRYALGVSQLDLDAIAGLADGHTSKIACGTKAIGRISLPNLLAALGLRLAVVEDDEWLPSQTVAYIDSSKGARRPRGRSSTVEATIPALAAPASPEPAPALLEAA